METPFFYFLFNRNQEYFHNLAVQEVTKKLKSNYER